MKVLKTILFLILASSVLGASILGQEKKSSSEPRDSVKEIIGKVISVDLSSKQITILKDSGDPATVVFVENTKFSKVSLDAKTTDDAIKISVFEIKNGDRLFAKGSMSSDGKIITTASIIVLPQAELKQKQELERQKWLERGISGKVTAIDTLAKEITLLAKTPEGEKSIIIEAASENVRFRRYASDSVKYENAVASNFSDIKVGDRLRSLGERSTDGLRFKPGEIISGSFKTLGGTIQSLNSQTKEVTINTLSGKKPIVIAIGENSLMRSISSETALIIIEQIRSSNSKEKSRQQSVKIASSNSGNTEKNQQLSLQNIIENSPAVNFSELKMGDEIMFTIGDAASEANPKALVLLIGVKEVLNLFKSDKKKKRTANLDTGIPLTALNSVDLQ